MTRNNRPDGFEVAVTSLEPFGIGAGIYRTGTKVYLDLFVPFEGRPGAWRLFEALNCFCKELADLGRSYANEDEVLTLSGPLFDALARGDRAGDEAFDALLRLVREGIQAWPSGLIGMFVPLIPQPHFRLRPLDASTAARTTVSENKPFPLN